MAAEFEFENPAPANAGENEKYVNEVKNKITVILNKVKTINEIINTNNLSNINVICAVASELLNLTQNLYYKIINENEIEIQNLILEITNLVSLITELKIEMKNEYYYSNNKKFELVYQKYDLDMLLIKLLSDADILAYYLANLS